MTARRIPGDTARDLPGDTARTPSGDIVASTAPATGPDAGGIRIVPANEASWADIQTVFGTRGDAASCRCQWFKLRNADWRATPVDGRTERLREQTGCDDPHARSTSGLLASLDGEPAGWCAVEPRIAYPRLETARIPWAGRDEDRADATVWAITCFVTRVGFRRRGISTALARAAVAHARSHGAAAIEGYPLLVSPGTTASWGELYVGAYSVFAAAGFREVSRPTERRAVMRLDF